MKRFAGRSAAEHIVSVATDLFYHKGFRAVGVEEIAGRSGVTKPTLYRHFVSKDELGVACLNKLADQDIADLATLAEQHAGDPLAQIRAIVEETSRRILDPGYRGWPMSNAEIEIADPAHPARRVSERYKARVRAHLQALCGQAGFERPAIIADGLFLLIEGATAAWHSFGPAGPSAHLSANCETLMASYQCDPSKPF